MLNKISLIIVLIIIILLNLAIGVYFIKEGYETLKTKESKIKKAKYGIVDPSDNTPKYKYNNYNVQYHDSIDTILANEKVLDMSAGSAFVLDENGNMVELPSTGEVNVTPTYYQPGSYKFGASTYVPSYEDTIYLSRTTSESSATPVVNTASIAKGFCSEFINQPDKLEEACMKTNVNSCATTSCCVLLGGTKCVSGNKQGPYMKENYGDTTVLNRDYYYYKGKCYGNCPGTDLQYASLGDSTLNKFVADSSNSIVNNKITDASNTNLTITDISNSTIPPLDASNAETKSNNENTKSQ